LGIVANPLTILCEIILAVQIFLLPQRFNSLCVFCFSIFVGNKDKSSSGIGCRSPPFPIWNVQTNQIGDKENGI
ncbi:MAG: hypothetical protein PUE18_06160, partial [Firmicutes bacterium]|nr:hypothetical protein [Bacillota bacterium]